MGIETFCELVAPSIYVHGIHQFFCQYPTLYIITSYAQNVNFAIPY